MESRKHRLGNRVFCVGSMQRWRVCFHAQCRQLRSAVIWPTATSATVSRFYETFAINSFEFLTARIGNFSAKNTQFTYVLPLTGQVWFSNQEGEIVKATPRDIGSSISKQANNKMLSDRDVRGICISAKGSHEISNGSWERTRNQAFTN